MVRPMICPHCRIGFKSDEKNYCLGEDNEGIWVVGVRTCTECRKLIVALKKCNGKASFAEGTAIGNHMGTEAIRATSTTLVRPKGAQRSTAPPEVPNEFAADYNEACLVLPDSAKASAALSRRCLQHVLREIAKVKHSDLFSEIQEILNQGKLPSHIGESIDAVRNIGNFAAHPIKSKSSGDIVDVEPGEAEWNLDVLEMLFDFYFVQPAIAKKKKDALNAKLKDAGKNPMK